LALAYSKTNHILPSQELGMNGFAFRMSWWGLKSESGIVMTELYY